MDKSLEHYRMILKRTPGTPLPQADLPDGYAFVFFEEGDELAWGNIEASVLEFQHADEAADYFRSSYLPYISEVKRRTLFIKNGDGEKVATFTAWWNYTGQRRHPFMHWVAVSPSHQGLGLGKSLIARGVSLMVQIEGDTVMYIPTQTWSHKAIKLYRWAGFDFVTDESAPGGFEHETGKGITVIEHLI